MSVYICDAIMGSGKSESAIRYINEHPNEKFVYISPYTDEDERIKTSCVEMNFVEPEKTSFRGRTGTKYQDTLRLLKEGYNIASTHAMFLHYTQEMGNLIQENGYTLIIDEALDIFQELKESLCDITLMKSAGWLIESSNSGSYTIDLEAIKEYENGRYIVEQRMAASHRLILIDDKPTLYYWVFCKEILEAFKNVFVLTYMFSCQTLCHYFNMNRIDYQYINIVHPDKSIFRLSTDDRYIPDYVKDISSMITIEDDDKLNEIGIARTALSMNWHKARTSKQTEVLRKNLYNYFINHNRGNPVDERLFGIYSNRSDNLKNKGFSKCDTMWNLRATNQYRNKKVLAYLANPFMNVHMKKYFEKKGIDVEEDKWALSMMIQWIWRSAIRDGKAIKVYVPSLRMRTLFINWMNSL